MKILGLIATTCALAFMFSTPAEARMRFGTEDKIHHIQSIDLTGPNGELLFLGYKTTTRWFLAGIYVKDGGYVLGVRGTSDKYMEMPAGEFLTELQTKGLLPDPLPAYSISAIDYIFGYSLWILLVGIVLWTVFQSMRSKYRRAEPA